MTRAEVEEIRRDANDAWLTGTLVERAGVIKRVQALCDVTLAYMKVLKHD